MAEEPTGKCAHGACDCPPEEGSKFCSEYCKEAEKWRVGVEEVAKNRVISKIENRKNLTADKHG